MTRNAEGCVGVLGCLGLAGAFLIYGASVITTQKGDVPAPKPKIVQKEDPRLHGLIITAARSVCDREIPWEMSINVKIVEDMDKIARYRLHGTLVLDTATVSRPADFYCDVAIDQTVFNPDKTVKELRAHVIKWDLKN